MSASGGGVNLGHAHASMDLDARDLIRAATEVARHLRAIMGPSAEADRGLQRVEQGAQRTAGVIGSVIGRLKGLAAGLSSLGLIGLGVQAAVTAIRTIAGAFTEPIMRASDLSESVNKIGVVFEQSAADILAWSRTTGGAIGQSQRQALAAAGDFGNLFKAMGLAPEQSAKMSRGLVELASDIASFNNIDPTEALEKLKAGLVGETEPLRSVGVLINETAVNTKLLELGMKTVNGEFTEQQKVMARYAIILDQTKAAQGDFARTATGMANSLRIIRASWDNFVTALGSRFIAGVEPFLGMISRILPNALTVLEPLFDDLGSAFQRFSNRVAGLINTDALVGNLGRSLDVVRTFVGALSGNWQPAPGIAQFAELAGRLGTIIREIALNAVTQFRTALEQLGQAAAPALAPLQAVLTIARNAVLTFVGALNGTWVAEFASNIDLVSRTFGSIGISIRAAARALLDFARGEASFKWVLSTLGAIANFHFGDIFTPLFAGIDRGIVPAITGLLQSISNARTAIINQLGLWAKALAEWVAPAIPALLVELSKVADQVIQFARQQIPAIAAQYASWAEAIGAWGRDALPAVTASLGPLVAGVLAWIRTNAGPIAREFITEWVPATVNWLLDAGTAIVRELGPISDSVLDWVAAEAPGLTRAFIGEWVPAVFGWVGEAIGKIGPHLGTFIQAVGAQLVRSAPRIKAIADGVGAGLVQGIGDALAKAGPVLQQALVSLGGLILTAMGQVAEGVGQALTTGLQAASDTALATLSGLGTQLETVLAAVPQQLATLFAGLVGTVTSALAPVGEAMRAVWESAVGIVTSSLQTVQQAAATGWQAVVTTVQGILGGLGAGIQGALSTAAATVTGTLTGIRDSILGAWQSIPEDIRNDLVLIGTTIAQRLQATIATVITTISGLATSVTTTFNGIVTTVQAILGRIATVVTSTFGGLTSTTGTAVGSFTSTVTGAFDRIVGAVSRPMQAARDAVVGAVTAMVNAVSPVITGWVTGLTSQFDSIKTSATQVWETIQTTVTRLTTSITSTVGTAWESISTTTTRVWDEVSSAVGDAVDDVLEAAGRFATDLVDAITGAAKDVGKEAEAIGKALIDGIAAGFNGAVEGLKGMAAEAARGMLRAAKAALDIRSPSGVFAREVGAPMAEGVAAGFESVGLPGIITDLVQLVEQAAKQIGSKEQLERFTKVAGAISAAARAVSDVLASTERASGFVAPLPEQLDAVAEAMQAVMSRMVRLTGRFGAQTAERVQQLSQAIGAAFSALGTTMETITRAGDLTSTSTDGVLAVADATEAVLVRLTSLGRAFRPSDGAAIETASRAITAGMQALGAALTPLLESRAFVGPSPAAIQDVVDHIRLVLANLADIGESIATSALVRVGEVARASQVALAALGAALSPLTQARTFIGPSPAAIQDVVDHIRLLFANLVAIGTDIPPAALNTVRLVAGSAETALGALTQALTPLTRLRRFIGPSPAAVQDVVDHIRLLLDNLRVLGEQFTPGQLTSIRGLSEATQTALTALGSALDPLRALRRFTAPAMAQVDSLITSLRDIMGRLVAVGGSLSQTDLAAVTAMGQAVQAAFGGLSSALTPLTELRSITAPATASVDAAFAAVAQVVSRFQELASAFEGELAEATTALGQAAQAAFGALGAALDVLPKLAEVRVPASDRALNLVVSFVERAVVSFQALAQRLGQNAVDDAATFADQASKVVSLLGAGVDGFVKLGDLQDISPAAIRRFADGVGLAVAELGRVARLASVQLTREAAAFSEQATKALGVLGAAASLQSLNEFVAPSRAKFQQFFAALSVAVDGLVAEAQRVAPDIAARTGAVGEQLGKAFGALGTALSAFIQVGEFNPGRNFERRLAGVLDLVRLTVVGMQALAAAFPDTSKLAQFAGVLQSVGAGIKAVLDALNTSTDAKQAAALLAQLGQIQGLTGGVIETRKVYRLEVDVSVRSQGATAADQSVAREVGQQTADQIAAQALRLLREELQGAA